MANSNTGARESWNTRLGVILAMAGSAIGLGNFLRFPVQAAENGGGAFMIPYLIAFFLLGIPIMWIEWAMGRYGGARGHGTTPAIFNLFWNSPVSKILGVLGLWLPLVVVIYYIYIESWTLGYSFHFITGAMPDLPAASNATPELYLKPFSDFLGKYIGSGGEFFNPTFLVTYLFFLLTFGINIFILLRGVSGGIERFAKVAMPALFVMAIILFFRVLLLKTPHGTSFDGLNFLWKPDFAELSKPSVWIAAAGQIFFTLSIGFGAIVTYASYLKKNQDIVVTSLTSASMNKTAEVVLGGSIAIPAAVAFFGVAGAVTIAKSGSFSLGFVSLSAIFSGMPAGQLLGFLWFFLLFFAGLTSSVSLTQPVVAFFQDEFNFTRRASVLLTGLIIFISAHMVIFLDKSLDEMDFWAGTIGIVLFGLVELIMFMWIFGGDKAWAEINRGSIIKVPRLFYYVVRYITPAYLLVLLGSFAYTSLPSIISESNWKIWVTRVYLIALFIFLAALVVISSRRGKQHGN